MVTNVRGWLEWQRASPVTCCEEKNIESNQTNQVDSKPLKEYNL